MLEPFASRLERAYSTWPSPGEWLLTLGLFLAFAFLAFLTLRVALGVALRPLRSSPARALLLFAAALLSPALLEETFYRVLLLPHPLESVSSATRLGWAALSLALYVLAHPLTAWRWPWARVYFWRPAFLMVVALLGLACTLAYLWTGSVWSPVFIHALTTAAWKLGFGGPARPFAGITKVESDK